MAEGERQPPPDSSEETPPTTQNFIIPKKEIHTVPDMGKWKRSQAYADYIGFILTLNEGVKGKKLTFDYKVSEAIEKLVALLDTLDRWIDETPPVDQPSRFGNKAYRTWYAKLDQEAENLVATVVPTHLAAAVPEVAVYLKEAVGNSTRIDYGTGHEAAFAAFLCCLCKIGVLRVDDQVAIVFKVFDRYLEVMRKLQKTYRMEPAGSQGVWGLDDFHKGTPATLSVFEGALFQPFTIILQQDIDQYIPYVFQLLAQMLEFHEGNIPNEYRGLLSFLLTPAIWAQKGSIPGLVKLLKAYLSRDGAQMIQSGQLTSLLGIIQQRLIPSKQNDAWGFELLEALVRYIPANSLQQYFDKIMIVLLGRLQSTKTDKYVYLLAKFFLYMSAINITGGVTVDFIITALEGIQSGLWTMVLTNIITPEASRLPVKDRKIGVVGLTRLLTDSTYMLQQPNVQQWPTLFNILVKQFVDPQYLEAAKADTAAGSTDIDYEEQTAGYQAAYSQLAASSAAPEDPVAYVRDPKQFVVERLGAVDRAKLQSLLSSADRNLAVSFLQGTGLV